MLKDQLINMLHQLNRADKRREVQLLLNDFALEGLGIVPGGTYEVWSPYDSAEAATILTRVLEEHKQARKILSAEI